ncbi:MAG: hypothetical protein HWN81_05145 [Candidatus Lokiarchaeota archaeon]|nr:hypothetical protein [Candidatus Lokiarchaeota archaeon]
MHFLKLIVKTPILDDPAKNHKNIHRHFYRYSKGDFIGPALKISQTKAKFTLKGSHEYEDLILEIAANGISNPDENFEIKGRLISGVDISDIINDLGFNWNLTKSTGKTQNYKAEIIDNTNKNSLIESIEAFRESSYFLLSFNINPNCKVTTKKNIPQPSKKKAEEDVVTKRIQFCTGYINNTGSNFNYILKNALPDFQSEFPRKWKTLTIFNNYIISEIELPKNVKNSRLLRVMGIRKGKLLRTLEIDGEIIEKQYSIVV